MTPPATLTGHLPEHLIVGGLVAIARWAAPRWGVGQTVRIANDLASRLVERARLRDPVPGHIAARTEVGRVAALRASRLVPGANCLHRAFALRVWFGSQGVESRIVIGFRKRESFEGHAWIEIACDDGSTVTLFCTDADGYREVADEALILAKLRFR